MNFIKSVKIYNKSKSSYCLFLNFDGQCFLKRIYIKAGKDEAKSTSSLSLQRLWCRLEIM